MWCQPCGSDWEWVGTYEPKSVFRADGELVELVNPDILQSSRVPGTTRDTYAFSTSDLRGIAALMFQKHCHELNRYPEIDETDTFPYRTTQGACFACEYDDGLGDISREDTQLSCRHCPKFSLHSISAPELIKHNSAHILHDLRYKDAESPCALCLSSDCCIYLISRGKIMSIDMDRSRCPRLRKFALKTASEFSENSPCTNHPILCPHCPKKGAPAIWKYNLRQHLLKAHPTSNPDIYNDLYGISEEEQVLLLGVREKTQRTGKKGRPARKLIISEGHSTRLLLREAINDTNDTANESVTTSVAEDIDTGDSEEHKLDDEVENIVNDAEEELESGTPNEPEFHPQGTDIVPFEDDEAQAENPQNKEIDVAVEFPLRQGLRKRKQRQLSLEGDDNLCSYHMACRGLLEKPSGNWFCDSECRKNAGFRVAGHSKRRL
ncbi:hypothetical protein H0H93_011160 [Arthromyces matolae]|nr:hypothetical protein H0H93_011160 [Arthromyces matolae]